jgi:hypothetical protein
MSYVVYQVSTGFTITDRAGAAGTKVYRTEAAAQACKTRLVRKLGYQRHELAVCEYQNLPSRTRTVTNLMSGKPVEIDVNTPLCCDPSSETYWSM